MGASFEYRLSRDEYVVGMQALTSELAKSDRRGPRRIFESLVVCVGAMLLALYFYPEAFPGLIVAAFLILLVETALLSRRLRSVTGQSYDPALADLRVEIGDEGIEETAPGRKRGWTWGAVRRVQDRGSAIVIELVGWDMIVLPSRLWPDDQGKSRFVDEIRARLPEAAAGGRPSADAVPLVVNQTHEIASIVVALVPLGLIAYLVLPVLTERYGPLADRVGLAGGMGLVVLASAAAGYPLYRQARRGLDRLYVSRPGLATVLAQLLVLALPFYMAAMCVGLL